MLVFALACLFLQTLSIRKDKVDNKQFERPEIRHDINNLRYSAQADNHLDPTTHTHIRASDLLQNYRPMGHHQVGLWDDYQSLSYKYAPDYTDGVKGHMWKPPIASPPDADVFKIASPKPAALNKPKRRIIADLIPPPTLSASVLDPPKRVNVIQIDLPTSTKKEIHYEIDPRTQLAPDVKGSTFHGIEPERPVRHGVFLEKKESIEHPTVLGKSKNTPPTQKPKPVKKTEAQKRVDGKMSNITGEALEKARAVELQAKKLSESIEAPQAGPGQILIKIAMKNKRETPDLKLNTK